MNFAWLFLKLRIRRYKSAFMMLVFLPAMLLCTMVYSYVEAANETALLLAKKAADHSKIASAPLAAEQAVREGLPVGLGILVLLLVMSHLVYRLFESPSKLTTESEKFLSSLPLTQRQINICGLIDNLTAFNTLLPFALAMVPSYLAFLDGGWSGLMFFAFPAFLAAETFVWAVSALFFRASWVIRDAMAVVLGLLGSSILLLLLFSEPHITLYRNILFYPAARWLGETLSGRHRELLQPWNVGMYSAFVLGLITAVWVHKPRVLGWGSAPLERHGLHIFLEWLNGRIFQPAKMMLRKPVLFLLGSFLFLICLGFETHWARTELESGEYTLFSPAVLVAALLCGVLSRGTFGHFAFLRNLPVSTTRIIFDSLQSGIKILTAAFVFKSFVFLACALIRGHELLPAFGHCLYLLLWILPFSLLCASVGLLANLLCEKSWQNRRWQSNFLVFSLILMQEMFFVSANLCFSFWLNEMPFVGLLALCLLAPLYFFFATVLFDRIDMVRFTRKPVLEARN